MYKAVSKETFSVQNSFQTSEIYSIGNLGQDPRVTRISKKFGKLLTRTRNLSLETLGH